MSNSKDWYEGRASGLYGVDLKLRSLIDAFTAGDQDIEVMLLELSDHVREDMISSERAAIKAESEK
jgi:hypothetical protein